VWDYQERLAGTAEQYNWSPLHGWLGMIELIWVGFLIHQLAPTGWLFWVGCGLGVWKKQRRFFALSILAAVVFGWSWPWTYFALMSV